MAAPSDDVVSRVWQAAYRALYRAARVWWFIRRPRTRGAIVALWHGGCVLLVHSSYRSGYGLPGGFVKAGEPPRDAAARELAEEVDVTVSPEALTPAWHGVLAYEHRLDDVTIFETTFETRPDVRIDGREVIWAGWERPEDAIRRPLLPQVRRYLEGRLPPYSPRSARIGSVRDA
jgi:8-oxo-dGTP pyrophosphatase MutT (NUDIX family)